MASRLKAPKLTNPDLLVRLARNQTEIEAANYLIYRNYVNLYWPEDERAFQRNKYLHAPSRRLAVAIQAGKVIGTMSALKDSALGLPSDTSRHDILRRYRKNGERLAEITSFAVDRAAPQAASLSLFLMKFFMQYSFYYAGIDRLIVSCRPRHADFYEQHLCFDKVTQPAPHAYAGNVPCQLVTLNLMQAHARLSDRYGEARTSPDNFYRFLLVDEHPNVQLPDKRQLQRSRHLDWAALATRPDVPIAV